MHNQIRIVQSGLDYVMRKAIREFQLIQNARRFVFTNVRKNPHRIHHVFK